MSATTIPPEDMDITAPPDALSNYQFGTMAARHRFCRICGIHTFVETRLNPGHYRVNLGCVDGFDALQLPDSIFDGDSLR